MNPTIYQIEAKRTECDQGRAQGRIAAPIPRQVPEEHAHRVRALHSVVGMAGEVGELASLVQKWLWYGKWDAAADEKEIHDRFLDELGDVMWYVAQLCNAFGFDLADVMSANIRKLKARYPQKYEDARAADENRDRAKEAVAVTQVCSHCKGTGKVADEWSTALTDCPVCTCNHVFGTVGAVPPGSTRVHVRCLVCSFRTTIEVYPAREPAPAGACAKCGNYNWETLLTSVGYGRKCLSCGNTVGL